MLPGQQTASLQHTSQSLIATDCLQNPILTNQESAAGWELPVVAPLLCVGGEGEESHGVRYIKHPSLQTTTGHLWLEINAKKFHQEQEIKLVFPLFPIKLRAIAYQLWLLRWRVQSYFSAFALFCFCFLHSCTLKGFFQWSSFRTSNCASNWHNNWSL